MQNGNHNPGRVAIAPIAAARSSNGVDSPRVPRRKSSEDGYTLLAVIFLLAILTVAMSVAVPRMTRSIQRDREVETMHRGKQYIRAVQLYYRKFHAYPPSMDALVKTNEIRFLRKKYIDPMTGKDDWKPLMFGQNKQPIVFGFFGQPMATGSTLAGIGASGGNGISGLSGGSNCPPSTSGTLGSIFGSQQCQSTPTTPSSTSGQGATTDSNGNPISGSGSGAAGATTDSNGNPISGSGSGTASATTDANGNPIQGAGTNGLSSTGITAGQTFGGAGIIGVTPVSAKASLLIYKKKNHYNEWEFDYDPMMEQMMMQGGNTGMIGTPASNMSNPIGNSGFGSTNNTFGGGQTGNPPFGSGPGSPPTTPTSPQQ
ncbi:MAG: type II secretion system protein [Terracidiphilus sp.]